MTNDFNDGNELFINSLLISYKPLISAALRLHGCEKSVMLVNH